MFEPPWWHSVQLACVVPQLYPVTFGVAVATLVPLLWHALVPHVPAMLASPTTTEPLYVKATRPARKFTVRFACVAAVCALVPWQLVHPITCPNTTLAFRCAPCAPVAIDDAVSPWHSEQLFVPPPSTEDHVYGESAAPPVPLLWQLFTPQPPNDASTAIPRLPVYTASPVITVPANVTLPFMCVATVATGLWHSPHTPPPPVAVERCAWCE
jgi:hypothetical protein